MHVITRSRLQRFWTKHPDAESSLCEWYKRVNSLEFTNFVELRKDFPTADQVGKLTIFNIAGNKYRLITFVDYRYQKVFIRDVLTHAEYDKEKWKRDPWNI